MAKLSEYRGEDALDVLADMIEPASEIFADKDVSEGIKSGKYIIAVKKAIKNHKKAVIELLAATEQENAEEYAKTISILTLPNKLLALMNDPEIIKFFSMQGKESTDSFGSATENTTETEKE